MNEENEEIEKIKIRIKDLEEIREEDRKAEGEKLKKIEKKRSEQYYKIVTYSLGSLMGGLAYIPVTTIINKFGITIEGSIIGVLICALYGLIISVCARDSPK